jgi:hypothetical protein
MNFHMVMEVIQKRIPAPTMVRIPGTHPKTLKISLLVLTYEFVRSINIRERPCLSHYCKTDLVSAKQPSSLLPRHCPELDLMTVVYQGQLLAAIFDGYLDQISPSSINAVNEGTPSESWPASSMAYSGSLFSVFNTLSSG